MTTKIICYGEILWDCLPSGKQPGGAPINVGYHLAQNGIEPIVVSAVGMDDLGDEMLAHLHKSGISTPFIARHANLPTGTVQVSIGLKGDAQYDIIQNVAWDRIEISSELRKAAEQAHGIVYGTLAQRSAYNLRNLSQLLELMSQRKDTLRIFDVNLRPPFDSHELVLELAQHANVIKLNDQEASILTGLSEGTLETRLIRMARELESKTDCHTICITAGEKGAGLLCQDQWIYERGRKVPVIDTVGAGDAFLAKLAQHLLLPAVSFDPRLALAEACRLGEWIATQAGAMPSYSNFSRTLTSNHF